MELVAVVLSLVMLFAAPLLLAKAGLRVLFALVPAGCLLLAASVQSPDAFPTVALPCVAGLCAGVAFKKKLSFQFYIITASSLLTALLIAHLYLQKLYFGVDLVEFLKTNVSEILRQSLPDTEFSAQKAVLDQMFSLFARMFPFYYFFNSLLWMSILWGLLKMLYKRTLYKDSLNCKGIEQFKLSDYLVFVLIAALALVAFFREDEVIFTVSLNVLLVCILLYLVQSIGIIKFFIAKKKLPGFILPAGILMMFIIGWPNNVLPVLIVLSGWGLIDIWTDFRKINIKDNPE